MGQPEPEPPPWAHERVAADDQAATTRDIDRVALTDLVLAIGDRQIASGSALDYVGDAVTRHHDVARGAALESVDAELPEYQILASFPGNRVIAGVT